MTVSVLTTYIYACDGCPIRINSKVQLPGDMPPRWMWLKLYDHEKTSRLLLCPDCVERTTAWLEATMNPPKPDEA